ncbi:MAG TPA: hypothetical protein VID47_10500, partial [Actinomycetota bacterium]
MALAIFAVGVIELTWFSSPEAPPIHVSGWSFAIFALMSLALVARRANVWIAASVITAGVVVATFAHLDIGGKSEQILATVLVFSVADRAPTPVALISVVAAVGLWWWLGDVLSQDSGFPLYLVLLADAVYALPIYGFAAFAGWTQRRRRLLTRELETRAVDLRTERERIAAQAVAGERLRLAGELRTLVSRGVRRMTKQ